MADENPHLFSTQTTGVTFGQITDDTDFPHTGLIKSLSLMAKGNMAVKGSATDFDITQASTGNVIQVAAGRIFKDNKFTAQVAAKNFTSSAFDTTTGNSFYHLLVVDSSNVLQVRKHGSSTANKVPSYTEGDTIIAVIMFNSSTAALGSMQVQFLTTGKVENSLSVGYDDSGYTEAGSLTGDSNGITMTGLYKLDTLPTATVATDDKVIIQDTNDSDKIKTVTAQAIADLGGNAAIVDNSGTPAFASGITKAEVLTLLNVADGATAYSNANAISAVEGEATLALTGDVTIAAGKDLTVDTSTLHVDSANNRVGIGTTTPSQELDVSGDIRLSGEIEINGNLNHDGSNVGFYGITPASRQSVGNLGSTAIGPLPPTNPSAPSGFEPANEAYLQGLEQDVGDLRTKLDALIDALQLIGLIS